MSRLRQRLRRLRNKRVRENRLNTGRAVGSIREVSKIASASMPSVCATGWRRAPARTQKKGELDITKKNRITGSCPSASVEPACHKGLRIHGMDKDVAAII